MGGARQLRPGLAVAADDVFEGRQLLGADRVLYAMDYPYEYVTDEVRWQDDLPLTAAEKKQFFQANAERVFGLAKRPPEGKANT